MIFLRPTTPRISGTVFKPVSYLSVWKVPNVSIGSNAELILGWLNVGNMPQSRLPSITPVMPTGLGVNSDTIDLFCDVRFGADVSRKAWSIALPQWAKSGILFLVYECRFG